MILYMKSVVNFPKYPTDFYANITNTLCICKIGIKMHSVVIQINFIFIIIFS